MKTKIIALFAAALCAVSMDSMAQNQPFVINGKLHNLSPLPSKIYLTELLPGTLEKHIDSTLVTNGTYQFKGGLTVDEAVAVTLSTAVKANPVKDLTLYLDKGELNIASEGELKNFKLSGSAAAAQNQVIEISNGLVKEKEELKRITATAEYQTNEKMQADVLKRANALPAKGIYDMYTFIKNNPSNRISPFTTYALVSSGFIGSTFQDTLVNQLPNHVKTDKLGQAISRIPAMRDSMLKAALAKRKVDAGKIPIGSKAPDFTENDPHNKPISLSSFKGKYVLVDFWASWCLPCRQENPNVLKAYNKYKDKGFTVLGVSLDSESAKANWLKAIASDALPWTQISDLKGWQNQAAQLYGVASIPQNFLIDPDGVVIATNLRGEDLHTKLASILK
ncbi:AhpC/TSA family protein [Mucilaginibacter sp. SMC90]|uniref:TlpA disulfide reductase family protein n=1 Tax=Mucilaginibacter sp. SMC90 TaxID=2929803 RepID=UPI001FB28665|nr:TlpA disulfide reductase family protein [Mucilaginibacter sp. SMC90]UOE52163.1 AhpC/TSA family protein [Mucilaginibacter sp. SMC90]